MLKKVALSIALILIFSTASRSEWINNGALVCSDGSYVKAFIYEKMTPEIVVEFINRGFCKFIEDEVEVEIIRRTADSPGYYTRGSSLFPIIMVRICHSNMTTYVHEMHLCERDQEIIKEKERQDRNDATIRSLQKNKYIK